MSFKLPDLIVESIIRDGFENARRDESVIDDIFCDLTKAFANKKYGQAEIEKIKKLCQNKEVSIVHSFNMVNSTIPCISIQLADDRESVDKAHMGNYIANRSSKLKTPEQVAATVIVSAFTPISYDPLTGVVRIPDSVNLAPVYANLLFVDAAGTQHQILGGIVNDAGAKQVIIEKQAEVDLGAGAEIKSSIDYEIYQIHGNVEDVQLILGIHTRDALTTKYLYTLVKYFMLSRKTDLISRGIQLNTYNGSDFHRNMEYKGEVVYTRFLNVSGFVQHNWRQDKVDLIDSVNVKVKVAKDRLGNEALNLTDQTIQVKE